MPTKAGEVAVPERIRSEVVERALNQIDERRRNYRRDAVDVAEEGASLSYKIKILDSREYKNRETKVRFGGAAFGLDPEVDAIAIVVVGFCIAAPNQSIVVGHQE